MSDIRIRWNLDVVDHGVGARLLRQDRAIRTSVIQTDKVYKQLGVTTTSVSTRQAATAEKARVATLGLERAALGAARGTTSLTGAQQSQLVVGQRIIAQSDAIAAAYVRRGAAAERASFKERAAARMSGWGGAAVGAANRGIGAAGAAAGAAGAAARSGALIGVVGGGIVTAQAIRMGTQYNRVIDQQNVAFTTLLKSQERAAAFMHKIQQLALDSPLLDVESAGQAARTLLAYGIRLKEVLPLTKAIGDMSAASGKSIQEAMPQAALAIGQIASKGKLQAQEMNQLANSVGLSRGRIRKALGLTAKEFEDSFKPGSNIKASEALPAILNAMTGQAAGAADRLAKTTQGRLQRAREVVARGMGQFTRPLYDAAGGIAGKLADALQKVNFSRAGKVLSDKMRDVAAAGGVALTGVGAFVRGVKGGGGGGPGQGRIHRGPGGRVESVDAPTAVQSTGSKIGAKVREIGGQVADVAGRVGRSALDAGKQLLDAFKPALPFLQNVLLPLLTGIGKGILGSIVGAFKVAVPIIKVVATVLGFVGRAAAPFRSVIEKVGMVIGFLAAGPILKLLGGLSKIGVVFRVLAVPIELVTGLFGGVIKAVRGLPGFLGALGSKLTGAGKAMIEFAEGGVGGIISTLTRAGGRVLTAAGRIATSAAKGLARMPARLAVTAYSAGRFVVDRLSSWAGRARGAAMGIVGRVVGAFASLAGAIGGLAGKVGGAFWNFGKGLVARIIDAIKSAPGAIIDAVKGLIPGPLRTVLDKAGGGLSKFDPRNWRSGGRVRRFSQGGWVDAAVSPGEAIVYGNQSWVVPGAPVAADSVRMPLPVGAAVLTGDGQARIEGGASIGEALRTQRPHFRGGGVVGGRYVSTAYGPPWGGINGTGTTATGVDLHGAPRAYGIAVDPRMIPLGSSVYVRPNPFGYGGAFRAFDTGGAIKGRRIDFYDWRGRQSQMKWGRRSVTVARHTLGGKGAKEASDAQGHVAIRYQRSRTRGSLIEGAFQSALDAARGGNPIGPYAFGDQLRSAIRGVTTRRTFDVATASGTDKAGNPKKGPGSAPRGLPTGLLRPNTLWNPRDLPIAAWIVPYLRWAAGHGWRGIVTSGYRDPRVKVTPSPGLPVAPQGKSNHNFTKFPGGAVDVSQAAQLAAILARRPGRKLLKWAGAKDNVHFSHPHNGGYRRGGIVGFRRGGGVGGAVTAAIAGRDGSINRLTNALDDASSTYLEKLRRDMVARARRGGTAKTVSRIQAVIAAVDNVLGTRVGKILRAVDLAKSSVERFSAAYDRFQRRQGIDPSSAAGLSGLLEVGDKSVIPNARRNVGRLARAQRAAKRAGHGAVARGIGDELAQARDDLDEALTVRVERRRALRATRAQERVDTASFGVDVANNALVGLDVAQRLNRTAETPGGMQARATAIQTNLVPVLSAQKDALDAQARTLLKQGDTAGFRQAFSAAQQAANDLASAMADAADLARQAAAQAAQDVVDAAGHGSTMASLGLQRLELEQRVAGTYDAGTSAQARADYIKAQVIPAIDAEIAALESQRKTAQDQGDAKLADQIAEAIAGKQNDKLQAIVDATEETADNTSALKEYSGAQTFDFGGTLYSNNLGAVGIGA